MTISCFYTLIPFPDHLQIFFVSFCGLWGSKLFFFCFEQYPTSYFNSYTQKQWRLLPYQLDQKDLGMKDSKNINLIDLMQSYIDW
jgi:hypothetical protein